MGGVPYDRVSWIVFPLSTRPLFNDSEDKAVLYIEFLTMLMLSEEKEARRGGDTHMVRRPKVPRRIAEFQTTGTSRFRRVSTCLCGRKWL